MAPTETLKRAQLAPTPRKNMDAGQIYCTVRSRFARGQGGQGVERSHLLPCCAVPVWAVRMDGMSTSHTGFPNGRRPHPGYMAVEWGGVECSMRTIPEGRAPESHHFFPSQQPTLPLLERRREADRSIGALSSSKRTEQRSSHHGELNKLTKGFEGLFAERWLHQAQSGMLNVPDAN